MELINNVDEYVVVLNAAAAQGVDYSQNPSENVQQQTRTVTVNEPSRNISADIKERVQRIEDALAKALPALNEDGAGIPAMGAADGVLDPQSFAAYERSLAVFAEKADGAFSSPVSDALEANGGKYSPAIGALIVENLTSKIDLGLNNPFASDAEKQELRATQAMLPTLIADLNYLHARDELKPVTMVQRTIQEPVERVVPPVNNPSNTDDSNNTTNENVVDETENDSNDTPNQDSNEGGTVEARTLSDGVRADNKFIQEKIVALIQEQTPEGQEPQIPLPRTDGDWDQASLQSVNFIIDFLKRDAGLQQDFPESGYSQGLGVALKAKIAENPQMAEKLYEVIPAAEFDTLIAKFETLSAADELRPSVADTGSVPDNAPLLSTDNPATATKIVEQALFQLGGQLGGGGGEGGLMGMVSKFAGDSMNVSLTEEQANDGVFDEASQDLTAKAVMMLKTMDGQENANGVYNAAIGQQLMISILTKPEFESIRGQISIPADEARLLGIDVPEGADTTLPVPSLNAAQARELVSGAPYDQLTSAFGSEAEYKAYQERVLPLQLMFDSLNTLQRENMLLSEEKAKQTNQTNLMLDMASGLLDEYAPGVKSFLQDFFENSEFGQMIGSVLMLFGINVGRLWGDKDDAAALQRAEPGVDAGFDHFFHAAEEELGEELGRDPNHQEIMARTTENMRDMMEGEWAFKKSMDVLFSDQDETLIQEAVEKALVEAGKGIDYNSSRAAFTNSILESAAQYNDNLDITQFTNRVSEIEPDIRAMAGTAPNGNPSNTNTTQNDGLNIDDDGSAGGTSVALAQAAIDPVTGEARVRDPNAPAVDAEIAGEGNNRFEMVFKANQDEWIQGPTRFSHGRVQDIQEVLGNNAEALELSLSADMMKINGAYSDMMTVNTNAVIEQTLILAQIHKLTTNADGTNNEDFTLTQGHLDALDRKLSQDNLSVVTDYMRAQGVSDADISKFSGAVAGQVANPADNVTIDGLATDHFSTDIRDPNAGSRQEHTVLAQSHFGNQFELKIANFAPANNNDADNTNDVDPNADPDPLRDRYLDYNKDKPCEVPMFYTKEGSGSVFALIRDKNGNDDPSDDQFKELELDHYLDTHRIQGTDDGDLKLLLDNYNWENPNELGVRNMINKVLCLDPFEYSHNAAPNVDASATQQNGNDQDNDTGVRQPNPRINDRGPHRTPEVFKDLRQLTEEQANFLGEQLALSQMPNVVAQAERDLPNPSDAKLLDALFERSIGRGTTDVSGFMILELEAFGLGHPDFDVVVAMRDGDQIDYRYIDYDTDYIKPIPEQRIGGSDVLASSNPTGARRLDDFLDEIDRLPGGRIRQGAAGGYLAMQSIVPSGEHGIKTESSMDAVYGDRAAVRYYNDYLRNFNTRFNERTGQENNERAYRHVNYMDGERRVGLTEEEKLRLDEYAQHQRGRYVPSDRQGEFNNRSGSSDGQVHSRDEHKFRTTREMGIPDTYNGVGAQAVNKIRFFDKIFGRNRDDNDQEASERANENIQQNMRDTGVVGDIPEDVEIGQYAPQNTNNVRVGGN